MQEQPTHLTNRLVAAALVSALAACSSSNGGTNNDDGGAAGTGGVACASGATCGGTASPTTSAAIAAATPAALQPFTAPVDPGPGGVLFAASGEALALQGYAFPPVNAGDPAFVDGWDVHFTRFLATFDDVTLSQGPNALPGDQSCTDSTVAKLSGPWAVDLSRSDPSYLQGKGGGGEQAVPFAALSKQNFPAGNTAAFDTSGAVPYAFGFDAVPATTSAINVNIDAAGLADYQTMIDDGCVVLYVGVATFKGTSCACPTAANPTAACDPATYAGWPAVGQSIAFHLCFKSPTSYVNCQNPDNDPAKPLSGEEHERGIFFKSESSIVAQVTFHTDHPFWDSVLHDSPAHFDQFAALVAGMGPNGADGGAATFPTVTTALTVNEDYSAYKDAQGHALNWRYCVAPPTDVHAQLVGPMAFDPQNIPRGTGCAGLDNYYDYSTYNQSTQGHLNSDGLCYVDRHYPSPR